MDTREAIRFWAGAVGASSLVAGVIAIVMVMRTSAPAPQPTPRPEEPKRVPYTTRIQGTAKPQPQATPVATATAPPAATTLTASERKMSEELWVEQKKVDVAGARVTAATPDGPRRVADTIAKQLSVPSKLVSDLHGRKLGYGEVTATIAFSQQLMKREKVTREHAIDKVVAARKAGQGWAAYARGAGLKIGDVLTEVRATDRQLDKLVTLKAAR